MERWLSINKDFVYFSVSLKNACELLDLASRFNASQLKVTCQQFICLNLAPLMETRSLDLLADDVIEELTAYYRTMVHIPSFYFTVQNDSHLHHF